MMERLNRLALWLVAALVLGVVATVAVPALAQATAAVAMPGLNWVAVGVVVNGVIGVGVAVTGWTLRGLTRRETKREAELKATTDAAKLAVDHATEASRSAALAVEKAGEVARAQAVSHTRLGRMMSCLGRNLATVDANVRESDQVVGHNLRLVTDPLRDLQMEHVGNHPLRPGAAPVVTRIEFQRAAFTNLEAFADEEYPT